MKNSATKRNINKANNKGFDYIKLKTANKKIFYETYFTSQEIHKRFGISRSFLKDLNRERHGVRYFIFKKNTNSYYRINIIDLFLILILNEVKDFEIKRRILYFALKSSLPALIEYLTKEENTIKDKQMLVLFKENENLLTYMINFGQILFLIDKSSLIFNVYKIKETLKEGIYDIIQNRK